MNDMSAEMYREGLSRPTLPIIQAVGDGAGGKETARGVNAPEGLKVDLNSLQLNQSLAELAGNIADELGKGSAEGALALRTREVLIKHTLGSIYDEEADWRDYLTRGERKTLGERRKTGNYSVEEKLIAKATERQGKLRETLTDFLQMTGGVVVGFKWPNKGLPLKQPSSLPFIPELPPLTVQEAKCVSDATESNAGDKKVAKPLKRSSVLYTMTAGVIIVSTVTACGAPSSPITEATTAVTVQVTPDGQLEVTKEVAQPTEIKPEAIEVGPPRVVTVEAPVTPKPEKTPTVVARSEFEGTGGATTGEDRLILVGVDQSGLQDQTVRYFPGLEVASLGVRPEIPGYRVVTTAANNEMILYQPEDETKEAKLFLSTLPVVDGLLPYLKADKDGITILWVNAKGEVIGETEAVISVPTDGRAVGFDQENRNYYTTKGEDSPEVPLELGLPRLTVISEAPVNVRSQPGLDAEVIGQVVFNARLLVSGKSADGEWNYCEWWDMEGVKFSGWVSADPKLVEVTASAQQATVIGSAEVTPTVTETPVPPTAEPTEAPTVKTSEATKAPTAEVTKAPTAEPVTYRVTNDKVSSYKASGDTEPSGYVISGREFVVIRTDGERVLAQLIGADGRLGAQVWLDKDRGYIDRTKTVKVESPADRGPVLQPAVGEIRNTPLGNWRIIRRSPVGVEVGNQVTYGKIIGARWRDDGMAELTISLGESQPQMKGVLVSSTALIAIRTDGTSCYFSDFIAFRGYARLEDVVYYAISPDDLLKWQGNPDMVINVISIGVSNIDPRRVEPSGCRNVL